MEKQFKGDKNRIERRLERERFKVPQNCDFYFLYENRKADNVGELINEALAGIEEANKTKLEGVFRGIDFNSETNLGQTKERNSRLKHLIEDFSDKKLDFRPSKIGKIDIIGDVYEYLISRFASDAGKKGGEFYTPADVATLLSKLVKPQKGDRICDPACGSGSLLIKVAREIGSQDYSLYGQESNGSTWSLGKMNMFLHEMDNARLEWCDTILNPKLIEGDSLMKFNIVVANPPFSLKKWGCESAGSDRFSRFHRGIPPQSCGDYAFISHMIETALEGSGKVGVIVPHGVLFRGGAEGKIRKGLIEENFLHTVVGLPGNLFFGTGIPTAILIFDKGKSDKKVLFIDASREFESGRNQNKLRDSDIEKILKTSQERKTVEKYSYLASVEEIEQNDFNLNIPRYVDTFEEEESVDIPKVQGEIEEIEKELGAVRKEMDGYLKELGF